MYSENLLPAFSQASERGQYAAAVGEGKVSYITRDDCPLAAAFVLVSTNYNNKSLKLTGPEAVSGMDIAAIMSQLHQKPVQYDLLKQLN